MVRRVKDILNIDTDGDQWKLPPVPLEANVEEDDD
jgi:hypothetical protein